MKTLWAPLLLMTGFLHAQPVHTPNAEVWPVIPGTTTELFVVRCEEDGHVVTADLNSRPMTWVAQKSVLDRPMAVTVLSHDGTRIFHVDAVIGRVGLDEFRKGSVSTAFLHWVTYA